MRLDYDEYCDGETRKRFLAEYPPDRIDAALRDQMKILRREQPDWFTRVPEATRREVATGRLYATLRTQLKLPSFEQWMARERQIRMF
jgi:hypothetical protein